MSLLTVCQRKKNLAKHNCLKTKSGGFRDIFLGKISGPMTEVAVPLTRNILALLPTMASAYASNGAIERKLRWQGVVWEGNRITLITWHY